MTGPRGVRPDGTLPASGAGRGPPPRNPRRSCPRPRPRGNLAVKPVGARPSPDPKLQETPVSTYSIWAPFDGAILDREMIVPGVAVDTAHRIFTMANLSSVWVEASIPESDFDVLARSRNGKVRFRSPAYPGHKFEGEVIYAGDLVEEQSRTVKLLAQAQNPERLLKPGMFLEVESSAPSPNPQTRSPPRPC